jgi:uncharacterized protein
MFTGWYFSLIYRRSSDQGLVLDLNKAGDRSMQRILFNIICVSLMFTGISRADTSDINGRLIQAAKAGSLADLNAALADGADINARDTDGVTALWMASQQGYADVVKFLLSTGAEVNVSRTDDGISALYMAALNGHADIVRLLLENGADIDIKKTTNGITALWAASRNGHADVVKLLLEKGADVNIKDSIYGVSALYITSQNGHADVVKLLLEKGADVNIKEIDGTTALWIAAQQGHTGVVKLLIEKGSDVNIKVVIENIELTALKAARNEGLSEIVKMLEIAGAKE